MARLRTASPEQLHDLHEQLKLLESNTKSKTARAKFLEFVRAMWPAFIYGDHHKIVAEAFERVRAGKLKRLMINMAPRHSKSEMGSIMLPAWWMGQFPDSKIIQASNTAELAVGFGRRVRNIVQSADFQSIFPGVMLVQDSKAAGHWHTNKGGEYFAIGVGGTVSGKGADLLIIDDPHSEQEAKMGTPDAFDHVYDWFVSGPRQRLQPNGSIIIIGTRWSQRDLWGKVLKAAKERDGVDQWEVITLPAILPSGNPLWPQYWPLHLLEALRNELPATSWSAQYMQDPSADSSAMVKREWWKLWPHEKLPKCEFIIQSWDCAQTNNEHSNPSACTTWGVFNHPDPKTGKDCNHIILIDAFTERMEFPALKDRAIKEYQHWKPDTFVIEGRSAGQPLIYELRAMGIPVTEYKPVRGNSKSARVAAVADLFRSGYVWYPNRRWAEDVIEEFAWFPNAEHDDLVDSSTQALIMFRQGGMVRMHHDEQDDEDAARIERVANYY